MLFSTCLLLGLDAADKLDLLPDDEIATPLGLTNTDAWNEQMVKLVTPC